MHRHALAVLGDDFALTGPGRLRAGTAAHPALGLFADLLHELAASVGGLAKDDVLHRDQLAEAASALHDALTSAGERKHS